MHYWDGISCCQSRKLGLMGGTPSVAQYKHGISDQPKLVLGVVKTHCPRLTSQIEVNLIRWTHLHSSCLCPLFPNYFSLNKCTL